MAEWWALPLALLVGILVGLTLGVLHGRAALRAYRLALEDEAKRMPPNPPCWVRGEVEGRPLAPP